MSKRISEEGRVVAFFRNAPVEVANAVFGIVKEEMKARGASGPGAFGKANGQVVTRRRKKRTAQATATTGESSGAPA